MRIKSLHRISSILVAGLLATQWALPAGAKTLGAKAGKLKTRTGVVLSHQAGQCTLDLGKRGKVQFTLSPQTQILQEQAGTQEEIQVGSVLQLEGQGQGNRVLAKDIILLPESETLRMIPAKKADAVYPAVGQATQVKAKVTGLSPLTAMNHAQQTLTVEVAPGAKVSKWVQTDASALTAGSKVEVKMREKDKEQVALEILIFSTSQDQTVAKE